MTHIRLIKYVYDANIKSQREDFSYVETRLRKYAQGERKQTPEPTVSPCHAAGYV